MKRIRHSESESLSPYSNTEGGTCEVHHDFIFYLLPPASVTDDAALTGPAGLPEARTRLAPSQRTFRQTGPTASVSSQAPQARQVSREQREEVGGARFPAPP